MLEILRADVGPLADELDAIVCCSDLQGVLHGKLLGVAVAELLVDLAERRVLPPSARTGIVLAGDLYSVPAANKRGGYGDVASVWEAFADRFPWIVGVAGNHDDTTNVVGLGTHVRVLDGDSVVVDGLCIGGVGRIIGNKQKPGRRDNSSGSRTSWPRAATSSCCTRGHTATTANTATRQQGNKAIRAVIENGQVPLTVCGHCHWERPLAEHPRGQILNVDARIVVLTSTVRYVGRASEDVVRVARKLVYTTGSAPRTARRPAHALHALGTWTTKRTS